MTQRLNLFAKVFWEHVAFLNCDHCNLNNTLRCEERSNCVTTALSYICAHAH